MELITISIPIATLVLGYLLGCRKVQTLSFKDLMDYTKVHEDRLAGFANAYSDLAVSMFNVTKVHHPVLPMTINKQEFFKQEPNGYEGADFDEESVDPGLAGGSLG